MSRNKDDGRIPAMIAEYEQMHSRIFLHQHECQQNIIQTLIICGVLYYFGITNFTNISDFGVAFCINVIFFLITPILLLGLIQFVLGTDIKNVILAKYIVVIEKRINNFYEVQDDQDIMQRIMGYDT